MGERTSGGGTAEEDGDQEGLGGREMGGGSVGSSLSGDGSSLSGALGVLFRERWEISFGGGEVGALGNLFRERWEFSSGDEVGALGVLFREMGGGSDGSLFRGRGDWERGAKLPKENSQRYHLLRRGSSLLPNP